MHCVEDNTVLLTVQREIEDQTDTESERANRDPYIGTSGTLR